MKILLLRSNSLDPSTETNITGIYPPLGLAYLASALDSRGHDTTIIDNQILGMRPARLKGVIAESAPELMLISSMTPSWHQAVRACRALKEAFPHIPIGVGGAQISAYPGESVAEPSIDFGVYGEGEITINEVARSLEEKKGLADISGVAFTEGGKVRVNPPRETVKELDSLAFPAIEKLPYERYRALSVRSPFFTMISSRGCPFKCGFCHQGYLGNYRARSAENVAEEITLLVKKHGIKEILFFDETFCIDKERTLSICDMISQRGLEFSWDIRTRVDLIDAETIKAMKKTGCSRIHIGIESGDQAVLDRMKKDISLCEIERKVRLAKDAGLEVRGYFMLAYPGETRETMLKTIEFSKSLPLDWASFTVTIGLPHTDIYLEALRSGYFTNDYWKEFTRMNTLADTPYFRPEGMSLKEVAGLKRKAYIEFYMRRSIIKNILTDLRAKKASRDVFSFMRFLPAVLGTTVGLERNQINSP